MKRRESGFALAFTLAIAASAGLASAPPGALQNLTPNTQAKNRGCRDGGVGGINKTNPSWVSVDPSDKAAIAEGVVRRSAVTHTDFPTNHETHDWNYFVKLDPQYNFMNSDANHEEGGERWMEMEWETGQFDMKFWPIEEDRTWTTGRWIFDCGHPPYRTEIHPPKLAAFTRRSPHIFQGDTAPSLTNKVFIYANPQGGYFYDGIRGVYEFDVPMPPRPSATAVPHAEVIETPFGGVQPSITLPGTPPTGGVVPPRISFLQRLEGRFQTLGSRSIPATSFGDKARIKFDLSNIGDTNRWNLYQHPLNARPPKNGPRFGSIVAVGWREKPAITKGYRVLRVTFDNVKINKDHDPIASGEWRMWANAGGNWFQINGLGDVDDGDTVQINKIVTVMVPEDGFLSVSATGWESDPMDDNFRIAAPGVGSLVDFGNLDENDDIGNWYFRYGPGQNFGIGPHDDRSSAGDYQIRYRIEEVQRIAPGTPNGAGQPGATGRKRATVILQSIKVIDDSDGAFRGSGEVYFNLDVNGQRRRFPTTRHFSIDSGKSVTIRSGTSVELGQLDTLRVSVIGAEDDSPDQDDDMGTVILNFTRAQNYGAGTHTLRGPKKDGQFEATISISVTDIR